MPLLSALWWLRTPCPAFARGMVRFPPDKPLSNKYYLVRPGESISDAEDLVVSNPVTKLDTVENGLTQRGRAQAESAASVLQSMNCEAPIIWYSTWGKSMQTAQILADQLGIQGDQRLPEYSYLDARGLGEFEGTPLAAAIRDMHKLDSASSLAQPPPTVDGTGAESAKDLSIRVLQMISIMETLAEGRNVIVVAADSDLLSVWQAVIAGAPLEGHQAFAFDSGEVRLLEYQLGYGPHKGYSVLTPGSTHMARMEKAKKIVAEGMKATKAKGGDDGRKINHGDDSKEGSDGKKYVNDLSEGSKYITAPESRLAMAERLQQSREAVKKRKDAELAADNAKRLEQQKTRQASSREAIKKRKDAELAADNAKRLEQQKTRQAKEAAAAAMARTAGRSAKLSRPADKEIEQYVKEPLQFITQYPVGATIIAWAALQATNRARNIHKIEHGDELLGRESTISPPPMSKSRAASIAKPHERPEDLHRIADARPVPKKSAQDYFLEAVVAVETRDSLEKNTKMDVKAMAELLEDNNALEKDEKDLEAQSSDRRLLAQMNVMTREDDDEEFEYSWLNAIDEIRVVDAVNKSLRQEGAKSIN